MGTIFGAIFCVALLVLVIVTSIMKKKSLQKIYEQYQEKDFAYTLVFGGYDWGPGTEKIILNIGNLAEDFTEKELSPAKFSVSVKSEIYSEETESVVEKEKKLEVKKVFICDIDGNEIIRSDEKSEEVPDSDAQAATHVALVLEPKPDDSFTSPFIYNPETQHSRWKKVYDFEISHPGFEKNMTECSDWFSPAAQKFRQIKTSGELNATAFTPENAKDGKLHPLIVWLHGAYEGGDDTNMVVLGNKVTALTDEKFQSYFDGAYILCPQTKTFWMQQGDSPYDILEDSVENKKSRYTAACKKIIDRFIKKNPSIDSTRIYIGGCSNGGYMTMNMLLSYPDFFTAAFPVCEAYQDRWLSDEDIRILDRVPTWFVAAKNDTTVPPEQHMVPTTRRLLESRPENQMHMSYFDSIKDSSGKYLDAKGKAYEYNGHLSWIPLFNDECYSEDDESLWGWLAQQQKL